MLNDSISHVHITCGQPDVISYTTADYWQETHCDSAFIEALSERDRAAVPELVEEFFCSGLDEEEQGKQMYIKINSTTAMCYG